MARAEGCDGGNGGCGCQVWKGMVVVRTGVVSFHKSEKTMV